MMVIKGVLFLFLLGLQTYVDCVGIGRVYIGLSDADLQAQGLNANPTLYTSSQNDGTGTFPVYLNITPTGTAFESSVNISCETTPSGNLVGYTQLTFSNPTLILAANTGTTSGTVSYTVVDAGRAINVQCYGVSTTGASGVQQFVRDTSMSDAVQVQVMNAAKVNFCSDKIQVPNIYNQLTSSFTLALTEPVETNNVSVTCVVTTNITTGGFINITMRSSLAKVNDSLVTMDYTITRAKGKDITVQCSAQSENGGSQFVTGTSSDQAIFTEDLAKLKFYPPAMKIQGTVFEPILMLDEPLPRGAQDVNFACQTELVIDQVDIENVLKTYVCQANPSTAGGAANTTNTPGADGNWVISDPNPEMKPGQIMKQLRVERNTPPDEYDMKEYVLLTCCVPSSINQSPKYIDKITSMVVDARMDTTYPVDFTTATDNQAVSETVSASPAFVNLAPCPCDFKPQICDIGCCCDANCTDEDKSQFDCLPGMFGGASTDGYKDESCLANPFPKPDWHRLLCVVSEENPLLGSMYSTVSVIKSNTNFITKELTAPNQDNFAQTESRTIVENVNATLGYTLGISIKTQGETGAKATRGTLSLPRKVFEGRCERKAPVRFLTDTSSDCVVRMTEAECKNSGSVFNAQTYQQSSSIKIPPCPTRLSVVGHPSSTTANPVLVPVSTNYYCASTLNDYVINRQPASAPASTLSTINLQALDACAFNDIGVYECPITTTVPTSTSPPRCSFDDGETEPPVPVWDSANKICRNAILDVNYRFTWSGTSIQGLTADYILGDVPSENSYTENVVTTETVFNAKGERETNTSTAAVTRTYPSDVTQKFKVNFNPVTTSTTTRNPDVLAELSGNPGYIPYKPIIGAVQYNNGSWNADKKYWPRYFSPSSKYLDCQNVEGGQVTFDEAVSGTCLLYLNLSDFQDCDRLRRYIVSRLDSMFPMEYVSMVGNPSLSEPSHWLVVERQNLTDLMIGNITTDNTTTRLQLSSARCDNIPIGISLDIMFADAGQLNDKFINRLVNAKINYQFAPMELKCTGVYAKDCEKGSQTVQPFSLYSAAQFIFVRSTLYSLSRWESFHYQCVQEFCKEEAMFPFTRYFQGGTYEESMLWMIAILGVTLFLLVITFRAGAIITKPLL